MNAQHGQLRIFFRIGIAYGVASPHLRYQRAILNQKTAPAGTFVIMAKTKGLAVQVRWVAARSISNCCYAVVCNIRTASMLLEG